MKKLVTGAVLAVALAIPAAPANADGDQDTSQNHAASGDFAHLHISSKLIDWE